MRQIKDDMKKQILAITIGISISLFVFASPGYEDFTTYTEQDVGGYLSETPTRVTATTCPSTEDVLLYYDKTNNHFDALDVDFELYTADAGTSIYGIGGIAITNTLQDIIGSTTTDIAVVGQDRGGTDVAWVRLAIGNFVASDYYIGLVNTLYYCTLTRAAGNDTVTVTIYSDAARTNLLDTLSAAGVGTTQYQYSMGFINYNDGTANRLFTGYIQNMDLNEAVTAAPYINRSQILEEE